MSPSGRAPAHSAHPTPPAVGSDIIKRLFALQRFGIKLGLEHITVICRSLENPQASFSSVLVAGTNGKGSVTAMVETALRLAGHRTGRYTSPHLVRLEERFNILGRPTTTADLESVATDILTRCDQLKAEHQLKCDPTFFEVTTAMALELFRRAQVEVAVLEVGMGGRFDATNVVTPIVGAITNIELDHQEYLGNTLAEIAYEKAGIIKPGMAVVVGESKPEPRQIIHETCLAQGAHLIDAVADTHSTLDRSNGRLVLTLTTPQGRYGPVTLALRGRHQAANAVVAVRVLEAMRKRGVAIPDEAILTSLANVRWPGRLDLISIDPHHAVLFDAAHNVAGARALAVYLAEQYPERLPIVLGVVSDKDAAGMIGALEPVASSFVLTKPPTERALDPHVLRQMITNVPADVVDDPLDALSLAKTRGSTVCVTGSLFLVGALYQGLKVDI